MENTESSRKRKLNKVMNDEEEPANKKTVAFSGTELRNHIKGSTPFKFLNELLSADNKTEKIKEYILADGSVSELLVLLNNVNFKKNINHVIIVFKTLKLFIAKCFSDFPSLHKRLVEECRQLLSIHLRVLLSMLSHTHVPKYRKASLQLLTVVVTCHSTLAWEVISKLNLNPEDILSLASKKKHNDVSSVRDSFIHFLIAFLIDQPTNVVNKFLRIKSLLISVFPGLVNDEVQLAVVLLEALRSRIIEEKDVSKNNKLAIFNTTSICYLFSVYNWDSTFGATHLGRVNEADKETVRCSLHKLLKCLLTSEKYGVIFTDPSVGTSGKIVNELVINVIKNAGQPWGDSLKEELYISMLSACPDLIKPFYNQIEHIITLSSTEMWCTIIRFLTSLLSIVNINYSVFNRETKNKLYRQIYMPNFLINTLILKLQCGTPSEKLIGTDCLQTILRNRIQNDVDISTTKYLLSSLPKAADDIINNLSYWKENWSLEGILYSLNCLLHLYQFSPQLLDTIRYRRATNDIILDCIKKLKEVNENCQDDSRRNLCCLKCIQLSMSIFPLNFMNVDHGHWLMDSCEFMNNEEEILTIGLTILEQTLRQTTYFGNSFEINIWIHSLSINHCRDVGTLVRLSLQYVQNNLTELYSVISMAEANAPVTERKSEFFNLDDFIDAAVLTYQDDIPRDLNKNFRPSILLVAVLKVLSVEKHLNDSCGPFFQELLTHVCHHCFSPRIFLEILKVYSGTPSINSVYNYMNNWITLSGNRSPPTSDIFVRVSKNLISSDKLCSWKKLKHVSLIEASLMIHQGIFYLYCGGVSPTQLQSLIAYLVGKYPDLAPSVLSHPVIIDYFSPLSDPSSFSVSNLIVLSICRTGHPDLDITPFAKKIAFDLRCSALKKVSLKKTKFIGETLRLLPIPKSDIQNIVDSCIPLPAKCLKGVAPWFEIIAYCFDECMRYGINIGIENFIGFLDQLSLYINEVSDCYMILFSTCQYLKSFYEKTHWSEKHLNVLNKLLKVVCDLDEWHSEFGIEIYKHIKDFNVDGIHYERSITLFASKKCLSLQDVSYLSTFLNSKYKTIVNCLCCEEIPVWINQLRSLIRKSNLSPSEFGKLCSRIEKCTKEIMCSSDSIRFLVAVYTKMERKDVLFNCLLNYILRLDCSAEKEKLKYIIKILDNLLNDNLGVLSKEICRTFILVGMKFPEMLNCLVSGLRVHQTAMEPSEVFALCSNHSLFLEIMLDNKYGSKYNLLRVILCCIKEENSLMKTSHIPVYLGSYQASLSKEDQLLVKILMEYEKYNVGFNDWKPVVWGQLAVQKYSVRESKKRVDISLSPTVDLLDIAIINKTIKHFPSWRMYDNDDDDQVTDYEFGSEIYDPVFILTVVGQAIGPGSDLTSRKIVMSGALPLALAALNSHCSIVRSCAYTLIFDFYNLLTEHKFDKLYRSFIDTLRASLHGGFAHISGPLSVFLARVSLIMSEPPHPLYLLVHNFLIAVPMFKTNKIPAFMELFHCSLPCRSASVKFILEIIRDGMRTEVDVKILLHSPILRILLVYYDSKLSDSTSKALIEEIIKALLKSADRKNSFLTKNFSILPWLIANGKLHLAIEAFPESVNYFFSH